MSLTSEQRQVLNAIKREARRRGAPRKHLLAAVETGLVESGLRNLNHGDADSEGWRQERASLYDDPTNLVASVRRFFDEAAQHDEQGITAGELAARVQRPAEQFRGRYQDRKGEAKALLQGITKGYTSPGTSANTGVSTGVDPRMRQMLLLNYLQDRGKPNALLELQASLDSLPSGSPIRNAPGKATRGNQSKVGGDVYELFSPGGFHFDNGQRQPKDYIGGHEDHVHVAGDKNVLSFAKRIAPKFGVQVTSTTGGKHAEGSFHYQGSAIDFASPDRGAMTAFAKAVARRFR